MSENEEQISIGKFDPKDLMFKVHEHSYRIKTIEGNMHEISDALKELSQNTTELKSVISTTKAGAMGAMWASRMFWLGLAFCIGAGMKLAPMLLGK